MGGGSEYISLEDQRNGWALKEMSVHALSLA